jgi:hypothetical protein
MIYYQAIKSGARTLRGLWPCCEQIIEKWKGIMAKKKSTPNFKSANYNYNQRAFIAISQEDQNQPDTQLKLFKI